MPRTDTNVPITPGSGATVDVIQPTGSADVRQVVVQGDPDNVGNLQAILPAGQALIRDDLAEDMLRIFRKVARGIEMLLDQEIPDED